MCPAVIAITGRVWVLSWFVGVGLALPAWAAEPRAAEYVPDDVLLAITLRDGDRRLGHLRGFLDERSFSESKAFDALSNEPGMVQLRVGLQGLAATAGTDAWSGLGALLGRELVLAIAPVEGSQPGVIAVSVARDDALVDRIADTLHSFAGLTRDGQPDPARSEVIAGTTVFSGKPGTFHCRVGGVTLWSNHRALLARALSARESGKGRLIDAQAYGAAERLAPDGAAAWAFADVPAIRKLAEQRRPAQFALPNPLGGFLFAAWWHHLLEAESAVAWLTPHDDQLTLETRVKSRTPLDDVYRGFVFDAVTNGTTALGDVPRQLASLCVQRQWRELWSEREKLLTLPAAGDLVNFGNTMSTLMGKLDFADDFLSAVDGPTHFILARQDIHDRSAWRPVPELPAFALVTHLKDAGKLARRLETASQMAISFLNYDAAQKNQPTFLLGMEKYKDCTIVKAEYALDDDAAEPPPVADPTSKPAVEDGAATQPVTAPQRERRAGVRYNFAPAAAVVADHYVVATTLDLLHDLIDRLSEARGARRVGEPGDGRAADRVTIDLNETRQILLANRETLVSNRMIEEDVSRVAAERFVDGFLDAFSLGRSISLTARCGKMDASGKLEIAFSPPIGGKQP